MDFLHEMRQVKSYVLLAKNALQLYKGSSTAELVRSETSKTLPRMKWPQYMFSLNACDAPHNPFTVQGLFSHFRQYLHVKGWSRFIISTVDDDT